MHGRTRWIDLENFNLGIFINTKINVNLLKIDEEGNTDYNEAGKPRLGDIHKLEIHIKESKAFKVY